MHTSVILKFLFSNTFLFLIISAPLHLVSQVGATDMAMEPTPPQAKNREEIYNPDGEYKLLENGKLRILGHHENRIKTGEFIYYNKFGQIEEKENYQAGLLHGEHITFNYGTPQTKREYYKGKKINYEYEFKFNDTVFLAGPYLKEEYSEGYFSMLSKTVIPMTNNLMNMRINYDTIFFTANKPIRVHHYSFIKTADKMSRDVFAVLELKTKSPSHSKAFVESLISRMQNYGPYYFPSKQNCLTKYYDRSGNLVFKSDSGYTVNYFSNGQLKDSLCICEEKKICRTGYNEKGELLYRVRLDKLSPKHTTNLYYDKNKTLIYEVRALNDKPEAVKFYNDSVQKKNSPGILSDCFGTRYFYNTTSFAIDSSMTRMEYKYSKKEKIPDGRYFYIAPKGIKKRTYRVLDIKGNYFDDYSVDSTLSLPNNKGMAIEMYRHDSIVYFVSENYYHNSNPKEEKYLVRKFIYKDGKFYSVHTRVSKTVVFDKQTMLLAFEADTFPHLKTELLPETEFKKALNLKSIANMSKKEYQQWIKRCEAIKSVNEKSKATFIGNNDFYYSVDLLQRVYFYQFYHMGYNPYVKEDEYGRWLNSLHLSQSELEKALRFLQ